VVNHLERGRTLFQAGLFVQAERELRQHLAEAADDHEGHGLLSFTLARLGRAKDALKEAEASVQCGPQSAYAFYALGSANLRLDRHGPADTAMKSCLNLESADPFFFALAAEAASACDDPERALSLADAALALDARHVEGLNSRALALMRLKRFDEADQTLKLALSVDPQKYYLHVNEGEIALRRKDSSQAYQHYREALRLNPGWQGAEQSILEAVASKDMKLLVALRLYNLLSFVLYQIFKLGQTLIDLLMPQIWNPDLTKEEKNQVLAATKKSVLKSLLEFSRVLLFLAVGMVVLAPMILLAQGIRFLADKFFEYNLRRAIDIKEA
jgi:tetratricopeptide (TPR) repeat protein